MHSFLADISIAVIAATTLGIIFHFLRQPVIVGYLVAGIIIGPHVGPQLIHGTENIDVISEIGIVLLLFLVGLEMSFTTLSRGGKTFVIPGIGQFVLSFAAGIPFFIMAGMTADTVGAAYLAAGCALSSTAIVVKSLYDGHEQETLHGRTSIGILIMQDLWALIVLVVLPGLGKGGALLALFAVGKTIILFAAALIISRYLLSRIFTKLTRYPEMTVAASIGWCTLCASAAHIAGLSPALGALAAGLSIANFHYHVFVQDKVEPLRDLFLLLFFVSLGMKITRPNTSGIVMTGIVAAFMIASRFVTIYPLVRMSGGSRRTAFLTALNLTQISEFSIVILGVGIAAGTLTGAAIEPILYLMAITAVTSSYSIRYGHAIYMFFARLMRKTSAAEKEFRTLNRTAYPVVILGLHRGSQALIEMIGKRAPDLIPYLLVIDYNAEILKKLKSAGIEGYLGDISRIETLEKAGISRAQVIVATIPQMLLKGIDNERLIRTLRQIAPGASIIASADFKNQVSFLEQAGADRVILPYFLAGDQCAEMVIGILGRTLPDPAENS